MCNILTSQLSMHGNHSASYNIVYFLADRTNGRAIATLLRLSSSSVVVCDFMYCG